MIRALSLTISTLALAMVSTNAIAQDQIIRVGNLLTDAASSPSGPATIIVRDGKIAEIRRGSDSASDAGANIIDLSTKTVMPGLIDLHVHLTGDPGGDFWKETTEPAEWGVVVGGHGDVSGFTEDVNDLLTSGYSCTGAVECAAKVRKASRAGSDIIKITATGGVLSQQGRGLDAQFTSAEMQSIADTAHSLGLKVMAHAHGARGIEAASRAGIDTIEHGTFADEAALKVMKANNTAMVPTLMAFQGVSEGLGKGIYTPVVEEKIRMTMGQVGKAVAMAKQMGVPVAFGTDAGVFDHGRNAE